MGIVDFCEGTLMKCNGCEVELYVPWKEVSQWDWIITEDGEFEGGINVPGWLSADHQGQNLSVMERLERWMHMNSLWREVGDVAWKRNRMNNWRCNLCQGRYWGSD